MILEEVERSIRIIMFTRGTHRKYVTLYTERTALSVKICEREINIDIATFCKHSCVSMGSIHCIDCSIHISNEVDIKREGRMRHKNVN